MSDFVFTLENEEELKAHKLFMITASPVFHHVLSASEDKDLNLRITDISRPTMVEICRYAYSDIVTLNHNNMLDVLKAASKLQMKFLVEKTVDFICKDGMSDHTVFKILEANRKDSNMRINMKCFDFIQKNHKTIFKSYDFQSISSDMLHAMLQTIKVPKLSAKEAIAFWSSHPDNSGEDLDELIALIELMEDVEEVNNNVPQSGRSDAGSVSSQNSSRRNNRQPGNNPNMRRQPPNQFNNQPPNGHPNAQHFNQQQPRNAPNIQQQKNVHHQKMVQHQHQFLQKQQQLQPVCTSGNIFSLQGRTARKHFTFANLDLMVMTLPVVISEIHFIYDLSTTDKQFELKILDVSGEQKQPLYYENVPTSKKIDNEFSRYVLPRPCCIDGGKKIWISIDFKRGEHRLSLENYNVAPNSVKDRMILRRESNSNASGQIISNIIFN